MLDVTFCAWYIAIHHARSASRAKQSSAQKWGEHTPPRGIRPAKLIPLGEIKMPRGEFFFFSKTRSPRGESTNQWCETEKAMGGGETLPRGENPEHYGIHYSRTYSTTQALHICRSPSQLLYISLTAAYQSRKRMALERPRRAVRCSVSFSPLLWPDKQGGNGFKERTFSVASAGHECINVSFL